MEQKDYYKILGITEEEKKLQGDDFKKVVSKHFRELSLKYHPDRHINDSEANKKTAEEKFKEINEANAVLSDAEKRSQYDNGGQIDLDDIFSKMGGFPFDDFNPFGFGGSFKHRTAQRRGDDATTTVTISVQEAYSGVIKEIRFMRDVPCEQCNGTGSSDGKLHTCHHCNGTGVIRETRRQGNMMFSSAHPCEYCGGSGKEATKKCDKCNGTGIKREYVTEKIQIPSGISDGMTFIVEGMGGIPVGEGIPGRLLVTVKVKEDSYYKIINFKNVAHYEEIQIKEALLGTKKKFKLLDGTEEELIIPECTHDGKAFIFRGKGMPDVNGGANGDFAVVIQYEYPNKLTDKQKQILKDF